MSTLCPYHGMVKDYHGMAMDYDRGHATDNHDKAMTYPGMMMALPRHDHG